MKDADDLPPGIPDKLFFRIGDAASLIGVEPHVLRYWESEFRLRPQRSSSGQRMYRRKDIGKLLRIKQLLHEEGFTIAGARKALEEGTAGAGAPSAAEAPVSADVARLDEAMDRLESAREQLASIRERVAQSGVAGLVPKR